jgi:hypothetical protein
MVAAAQTFTTFDVSGEGKGKNQGTVPVALNSAGVVVGFYVDASNANHAFVRAANGTITTFNVTGAGAGASQGTQATAINTSGEIAGLYCDSTNVCRAFVRAVSGVITAFDVAGAASTTHLGTAALGINDAGEVTGMYRDTSIVHHGFIRSATGSITTFDAPGAGSGMYQGSFPIAINGAGDVTGTYLDSGYVNHGFVRASDGTITTFDAPSAATTGGVFSGTVPLTINAAGEIAGTYTDASGARHGFVRATNGTITDFDAPGVVTSTGIIQGTIASSINTAGYVSGFYMGTGSLLHGFVRAANGTITAFSAPAAGSGGGMVSGTSEFAINVNGAATGEYTDTKGVTHGFVLLPATVITLTSSPNPSTFGEATTLTATITSTLASPPNGESITFKNGTTVLGEGTLSSGSSKFTTSTLPVGTDSLVAVYAGDANFAASTSKTVSQVVKKANSTTTLAASPNPSAFGQSITFTATVKPQFTGTPSGTVTFKNGTTTLATIALSGGVAKYTTSTLAVGTSSITAVYNGSASFNTSTSAVVKQVVNKATSTTTLAASPNPSAFGQSVTFSATVKPQFTGTPSGTVTFKNGTTTLATVTLSSGVAKYTTSTLAVGTSSITAVYSGSTSFNTSTSAVLKQVVNKATSTATVASSANPSTHGESVTFTATVKPEFTGTPTGSVTFKDGTSTLATETLAGGVAKFSTSTLAVGTHSITAVYGGSSSFASSTSAVLKQVVK